MVPTSSNPYPCTEKPLTSWNVPSAKIFVTNNVSGTQAHVFLCITTQDDAGYISIPAGGSAQIPYGFYSATAWVSGKKTFHDSIGFEIKTSDTRQIVIENGRIYIRAGCAPDC